MTPPKSEVQTITVPVDQITDCRLAPIRDYAESIGCSVDDILNDLKEIALHNLLGDRQRLSESAESAQTIERPVIRRGAL